MMHYSDSLNVFLVLLTLIQEQSGNGRVPSAIGNIVGIWASEVLIWADSHIQEATYPKEHY